MDNFFSLIVHCLTQIIEFVFSFCRKLFSNIVLAILSVSVVVTLLLLPLYVVAEHWQQLVMYYTMGNIFLLVKNIFYKMQIRTLYYIFCVFFLLNSCRTPLSCKKIGKVVNEYIKLMVFKLTVELKDSDVEIKPDGFGRIKKINTTTIGRSTNCKLNHAVLVEAQNGRFFDIFIFETSNHRDVKTEILNDFKNHQKTPKYNER